MKKLKQILTPTNILLFYSVLASTAALVVFFMFLHGYQWQQRQYAEQDFDGIVRNAQLAFTHWPILSVQDGRAYIQEAKLSLPLNDLDQNIIYNYYSPNQKPDSEAGLTVYSRPAIYQPGKDICNPLLQVRFRPEPSLEPGFKKVVEKALAGGRTLYVYANQADKCDQTGARQGVTVAKVADLFKRAQAY